MTQDPPTEPNSRWQATLEAKGPQTALRMRRLHSLMALAFPDRQDWSGLRVLDIGCGEGAMSVECALHGAEVLALDARTERMQEGQSAGEAGRLDNLRFLQADLLTHPFENEGPFDVVLLFGILYHFRLADLSQLLHRAGSATRRAMIIDTRVSLSAAATEPDHNAKRRTGWSYREHQSSESTDIRQQRLKASLHNTESFWPTQGDLQAILQEAGFATVVESQVPEFPFSEVDRVMLLAVKGHFPQVKSYPWLAESSDDQARERVRDTATPLFRPPHSAAVRAREEIATTLGAWCRRNPQFLRGPCQRDNRTAGDWAIADFALWRTSDVENYVGILGHVVPVLVVIVVTPADSAELLDWQARTCLDNGVQIVWQVAPRQKRITLITPTDKRTFSRGESLPETAPLKGLRPLVDELCP